MGHAKAILSLGAQRQQEKLYQTIVDGGLTVRQGEALAVSMAAGERAHTEEVAARDPHVEDLERRIQERLGTKVSIEHRSGRGTIAIEYYSLDDLDRVLDIFGV